MTSSDKVPEYLYRYLPAIGESSYAGANIKNQLEGRIRMTGVAEVNDPFDSNPHVLIDLKPDETYTYLKAVWQGKILPAMDPDFGALLKQRYRSLRHLKNNKAAEFRAIKNGLLSNRPFDEVGFSCWSELGDHPLMWSHYASSHRGICLKWKFGDSFQPDPLMIKPMRYSEIRPIRKWSIDEKGSLGSKSLKNDFDQALTKARIWEYEKEWRLFGVSIGDGGTREVLRPNQYAVINQNKIEAVILGCNVCKDTAALVLSHLQATELKVEVVQASLCDKSYSIKI